MALPLFVLSLSLMRYISFVQDDCGGGGVVEEKFHTETQSDSLDGAMMGQKSKLRDSRRQSGCRSYFLFLFISGLKLGRDC